MVSDYHQDAYDDEAPVRKLKVASFRFGRYPVTVPEYDEYRNRPVVGASWEEAAVYCKWAGGRLPIIAERDLPRRFPVTTKKAKVIRGGAWNSDARSLRSRTAAES